jgi:hypothetical protein
MKRLLLLTNVLVLLCLGCGGPSGALEHADSSAVQAIAVVDTVVADVATEAVMEVDSPPLPRFGKATKDSLDKLRIKEYNTSDDKLLDSLKQAKLEAYRKQGVKGAK